MDLEKKENEILIKFIEGEITDGTNQGDRIIQILLQLFQEREKINAMEKGKIEIHFAGKNLTTSMTEYIDSKPLTKFLDL